MIKRILKPSFRLKSAHTVVFSPCGKYLAQLQDSARIIIWSVKERAVTAHHKLIKSESYIGFSPDSSVMYCKNGNGELVFFETLTGKVLSETGRFKLYRSGGKAKLLTDNELLDGDSNGQIMLWDINDSTIKSCIEFKNHMVRGVTGISGQFHLALVYPKHDEKSSGCRILKFNEPVDLDKYELIKPSNEKYQWLGNWKNISKFCIGSDSKEIFIILDNLGLKKQQVLVRQDLNSGNSDSFTFDQPNEYAWSISNNDRYVFVVVHTNLYQRGMSSSDYSKLNDANETEHIHVFDKEKMKRVAKIFWPDVYRVACHPNHKSIAIAANKKSVFLDEYSVLLD
jgi:hypothetical protein